MLGNMFTEDMFYLIFMLLHVSPVICPSTHRTFCPVQVVSICTHA